MLESGFDGGLGAETDWPEGKRKGGEWGDSEERQLFVHSGTRGRAGSGGNECLGGVHLKKMVEFESVKMLMGRSCKEGLMAEERGMIQSFLRRQEFLLLERETGYNF